MFKLLTTIQRIVYSSVYNCNNRMDPPRPEVKRALALAQLREAPEGSESVALFWRGEDDAALEHALGAFRAQRGDAERKARRRAMTVCCCSSSFAK